jgi:ABC-type uncharacterized transport system substrate-binding protein
VVANETAWPEGFDGAARLTIAGTPVPLSHPQAMTARLDGDRLSLTFLRHLQEPRPLLGQTAEVAFYEPTYYYAFSITAAPETMPETGACQITLNPFEASDQLSSLQLTLAALGREETPEIDDVGALFADRIVLECR